MSPIVRNPGPRARLASTPAGRSHGRGLGIAEAERATGIPRATLRIWERRYGFPSPRRSASGERVYSPADCEKLRLIDALKGKGRQPGRLVALPLAELRRMAAKPAAPSARAAPGPATAMLQRGDTGGLLLHLRQELARAGVERFVKDTVAPLTREVGDAWERGELQIHQEHLYTHALQLVLGQAIVGLAVDARGNRPRVLLATFSGELHTLGLLMVQALLALDGCECVALGASLPLADIAAAQARFDCDAVAVSCSASFDPVRARREIGALREALPARVAVWAGGACSGVRRLQLAGVQVFDSLEGIDAAAAALRGRG
jgi:MerR family transcriptional regulator, light-induced transcriptional regulator